MVFLCRRTLVACPTREAWHILRDTFDERAEQGSRQFALRPPIRVPDLRLEISMQRDIIATMLASDDDDGPFGLRWKPADAGPFPRFVGQLQIQPDSAYEYCQLTLNGSYEPPNAGSSREDALLGHRIAQATAREFLAQIRTEIEAVYRSTTGNHLPASNLVQTIETMT
jgi:hypothetical protein